MNDSDYENRAGFPLLKRFVGIKAHYIVNIHKCSFKYLKLQNKVPFVVVST